MQMSSAQCGSKHHIAASLCLAARQHLLLPLARRRFLLLALGRAVVTGV